MRDCIACSTDGSRLEVSWKRLVGIGLLQQVHLLDEILTDPTCSARSLWAKRDGVLANTLFANTWPPCDQAKSKWVAFREQLGPKPAHACALRDAFQLRCTRFFMFIRASTLGVGQVRSCMLSGCENCRFRIV